MQSQKENHNQPNLCFGATHLEQMQQDALITGSFTSRQLSISVLRRTFSKAAALLVLCTCSLSISFAQCWIKPEDETKVTLRTNNYSTNANGSTTFNSDYSAPVNIASSVIWQNWQFITFASGGSWIKTNNVINFDQVSTKMYVNDGARVETRGLITMNGGVDADHGNYIYVESGGTLDIYNIKAYNHHNYIILENEYAFFYYKGERYEAGQIIQTGTDASHTIKIRSCIDGPIDGPLPVKFVGKPSITKLDVNKIKVSFQIEEQMNLSHYNVQVSRDGKNYKTVTIIFPKEMKTGTYSAEIDLRKVKF